MNKRIPEPSLRRLPSYVYFLRQLAAQGRQAVSTADLAQALKLDPTQVRKDLSLAGATGRPRVGYDLAELLTTVETFLGWHNATDAFLVGTGQLGSALLRYEGFGQRGLNILAAFDTDPNKIGTIVHGREIMHVSRLVGLAKRMRVLLGILTVPGEAAQPTAEKMVEGGMIAIWNFAPATLSLPEGIIVENEHLDETLAVLSHRLSLSLESR